MVTLGSDGGGSGGEATQEPWPIGEPNGSDSDGGRSGGLFGLPRWVSWAVLGALAIVLGIVAFTKGFSPGPTPSVSASSSSSADPVIPGFFDDGISEDEYPAPTEYRGEGYPEALTMADWVWDRVGPQWAIVLFAEHSGQGQDVQSLQTPVVYLVSPEGVYFELAELPVTVSDGATLVSWHEEERTARIVWNDGTKGGLLHLETGEVEDTSFNVDGKQIEDVQFLAANAEGKELWLAWGEDGLKTKISTWTAEDKWTQVLAGQDDLFFEGDPIPTSPDGSAVVFEIYTLADSLSASDRSLPPGVPNFIVYSLDGDESNRYHPSLTDEEPDCWFTGWIDSVSVGYECWNDAEGLQTDYRVLVDGSGSVEPYTPEVSWYGDLLGKVTVRDPSVPIEFVVDPVKGTVTSVRLLTGDDPVTIIDTAELGDNGGSIRSIDEIAPGILRLVTWDRIVIGIDTETATIGPTILAKAEGSPLMARSYIFFDEATPAGVGLAWDD